MAVLPQASLAVNLLVTVYSFAQAPWVVTSEVVIVTGPHASLAVGVANEGVAGHWMVVGPGRADKVGGALS